MFLQLALAAAHAGNDQQLEEKASAARFIVLSMSTPGEDQRWRMRRGTSQQNTPSSSQQGQRRNQSRDRNSYGSPAGYQGGNRDGPGNAWVNRGPPQGQPMALVDEHVPVKGFNSREVSEYLNRAYAAALNSAQNPYGDEASKPIIYKSPEKGWKTTGKASGGPWGSRQPDFLSQLRRGVAVLPPAPKG